MENEKGNVSDIVDSYLALFGNRWNLLILYELFNGPKRFNELKRALEPISQTVLTRHLKTLISQGVICREEYPGTPLSVYYSISEMGFSMTPSMISMYGWIEENIIPRKG